MTKKEIVKSTINGVNTGITPYSFDMTYIIKEKIANYYNIPIDTVHDYIGDYLKYVYVGSGDNFIAEEMNSNTYKDEFSVVWDKGEGTKTMGDWGGIVQSPLEEPSLKGYKFPNPLATGRFKQAIIDCDNSNDRYTVLHMDGILDVGWHIRGFENLMMDFVSEEKFAHELLDKALEYNLGLIESAPSCINGIRFGEDWGQQVGLFMGGKIWRTFLKPRLKKMYDAARNKGFQVLIHSCGDIIELFPDLIEMGVQVVNPIQPEVMNVEFIKKEYGNYITLYGGLGCQSTIPLGSVTDVISEAKERMELLSENGRYIFGPSGAIPTEAKIENVIALIDFSKNYNK